jgi:hypothetical protein
LASLDFKIDKSCMIIDTKEVMRGRVGCERSRLDYREGA